MADSRVTFADFYRLSERRMRISVDIDNEDGIGNLRPLNIFFTLKGMFPNSKVTMLKTRHGFHIKAVGEEIADIPPENRIDIRESLGDDPLRIEYDRLKLKLGCPFLVDVLFTMKRDFDGKLNIVQEVMPFALPYASRIPAKKKRGGSA